MTARVSLIRSMRMFRVTMTAAALLALGCAVDSKPDPHGEGSVTQRQDAAMKDPFSYGPGNDKSAAPADPGAIKRDDSMKGQMDRFWNP